MVAPPDKSISHRAIFFASIAKGESVIRNFLDAADPLSTVDAFRKLGIEITELAGGIPSQGSKLPRRTTVNGQGFEGLKEPKDVIDCGNSGTTMRLLTGLLAACPFFSVLTGDESLRGRPMARVITPLKQMGAGINGRSLDRYPPLSIKGGGLRPISYEMPVPSAQVKSSILLAGLYVDGVTEVKESVKSRDHTERMLAAFGADITVDGLRVAVRGGRKLEGQDIEIPGDISSAAFFVAASLLIVGKGLLVRDVGLNPTRTGFFDAIKKMGASLEFLNERVVCGEPIGDVRSTYVGGLKCINIGGEEIPSLIDEFPLLCVLGTQAEGITEIRGAKELRVKESDRISAMVSELRKMGARIEEYDDGVAIEGRVLLKGAHVKSYGDHRIAMALSVAALAAKGETVIEGSDCVDISYHDFYKDMTELVSF
ncbi:MAG: 3-phosphoshikimate 1-carboxyvinyltransferase [Nitrospirae bacterium]|nr:3-phosphoshikimate 1-carboxyvinyltransferase [Nitrospirota bacterium]